MLRHNAAFLNIAAMMGLLSVVAYAGNTIDMQAGKPTVPNDELPVLPRFTSGVDPVSMAALDKAMEPVEIAERAARQYFLEGDMRSAESACRRAIDLSPRTRGGKPFQLSVVAMLGEIRLAQGNPSEALQFLRYCEPEYVNESVLLMTTMAFCRLGDYKSALAEYERAMRFTGRTEWLSDKDPNRPGSRNVAQIEASVLLARAQRQHSFLVDHGEAYIRAAEKLRPENPLIAYELGKVLLENGKSSEAVTRFNRAASAGRGRLAKNSKRQSEIAANMQEWTQSRARLKNAGQTQSSKR